MLDAETEARWRRYLEAERDRIRAVLLPALDHFIAAITAEDPNDRREWAFRIAASVADQGASTPIRFPLFRQVLLPELLPGVLARSPGCARWLAHFATLLSHSRTEVSGLPAHLRSELGLLQEALFVDDSDELARRAFITAQAWSFEYSLHELPTGVLYGHNGATASECLELIAELSTFRLHVERLNLTDQYAKLISTCALHFATYRDYLQAGSPGHSYERFLQARGVGA